jgi:16S rRNA A1518/A1519 N6-dimethyltransferase RsmA/KsgA/DIM1 with predicted DNA glycosylase/AP lyase activity
VVEFGAGDGQLTAALASRCGRLVAVELDRELWQRLRQRFAENPRVKVMLADFLAFDLPSRGAYKLVSNVPFGLTSRLFRKLSDVEHAPTDAYLIVQTEAAQRWAGLGHETAASVVLKTRYEVQPLLALHRSSFDPRPNADAVLLRLTAFAQPLVPRPRLREFEAFVRAGFGAGAHQSTHVRRGSERLAGTGGQAQAWTIEDWVRRFRR